MRSEFDVVHRRHYGMVDRLDRRPVGKFDPWRLSLPEKVALAFIAVGIVLIGACSLSIADDTCPPGVPACKILVVTPQEEQTLTAPNGILDMAVWASRPLGDFANQWRDKLKNAPAGKPYASPSPEKPKE